MCGKDLFETLIKSTGLSGSGIRNEMLSILKNNNIKVEDLNIHILKEVMIDYLTNSLPHTNS